MGVLKPTSPSRNVSVGLICLLLGFCLHLASFSSPYWMVVNDQFGLTLSGLWRLCIFGVCDQFVNHGVKVWLHVVQTCMVLALISQIIALGILAVNMLTKVLEKHRYRVAVVVFAATLFPASLSLLSVLLYGIYQGSAGLWELAWAYWLAVASTFLLLISAVALAIEAKRLRTKPADQRPILHHSTSVDSGMALHEVKSEGRHPRSSSISSVTPNMPLTIRFRHNSFGSIPLTPESPAECQFSFDEVFIT